MAGNYKPAKIEETTAGTYLVNGKEVYRDGNNCWVHREPLTSCECKSWNAYARNL